jgi:hypothetical protein
MTLLSVRETQVETIHWMSRGENRARTPVLIAAWLNGIAEAAM